MSDAPKKLIPFLSRPLVMSVAALAWTVMVGAGVARYMVSSGLVDQQALATRAESLRTYRDRVVETLKVNRDVLLEDGSGNSEDPDLDLPAVGERLEGERVASEGGPISRRLNLSLRRARSEGLLPAGDPAVDMDESSLAKEVDSALARLRTTEFMQKLLPYFSECGLLMLLGIAFGLATKMAIKVAIVFGILLIGGMQYLAWQGMLDVNWGALGAFVHETLLNVTPQGDLSELLKEKSPALASLGVGAYLGLRG